MNDVDHIHAQLPIYKGTSISIGTMHGEVAWAANGECGVDTKHGERVLSKRDLGRLASVSKSISVARINGGIERDPDFLAELPVPDRTYVVLGESKDSNVMFIGPMENDIAFAQIRLPSGGVDMGHIDGDEMTKFLTAHLIADGHFEVMRHVGDSSGWYQHNYEAACNCPEKLGGVWPPEEGQ